MKQACLCAMLLCFGFGFARAASVTNADTAVNLNLGGSWVGGTPAGASDVAVWNSIIQVNTTKSLGADLSWSGIQILDPLSLITINAGNTLTLGASGVDMSQATNSLTLACPLVLGANQTWNVANGLTLTIGTGLGVSTATSLIKTGNGVVNFSSAVNGTYTGNVSINGGVAQINSGNGNNNSAAGTGIITNNGATLRFTTGRIVGNVLVFNGNCIVDAAGVSTAVDGAWQGGGTVLISNLTSSGLTFTAGGNGNGSGNFNNFTGSIIIATNNGVPAAGNFRFNNGGGNNNVGNAAMTLDLGNSSVHFTEKNSGASASFGALLGGPNTQLASSANYIIGGANLNTTFAGTILSSSTLTKNGNGTFILTGNNPYTGSTTINGGILQAGDGVTVTAGTLGTGAVVVNSPGQLVFNKPDDFSVANNISGAGTLVKQNTNALTYNGINSSSGTTIISQGRFALGGSGLISAPISLAAGAIFDVSANGSYVFGSSLSGFGAAVGPFSALGGTLNPGGSGAAGTLTFSNGLTESGSVNNQIELSSLGGTNDSINIVGDFTVTGTNNILVSHFGGGNIPNGVYPLITYSGSFNGGLSNLAVTTFGVSGTLTNPAGQIAIIITPSTRGATNLTWTGDGSGNNWDVTSTNWINGAARFVFQAGDAAIFDDTGATNPLVNVNVAVSPKSIFISSTSNYTFAGTGAIGDSSNPSGLTKTNSGTVTISTTNTYTGPTVVGGGVVEAAVLANGGSGSSIGAAPSNPTNLVFYGTTLRYIGSGASTDRGATLNGLGAIFDTPSATLTLDGLLTGPGALTKNGAGTLTLDVANNYSGGTVISNGILALGGNNANNNAGFSGVGAITNVVNFRGGTLQLFGYNGGTGLPGYNTFFNPLSVPAGQSGTLQEFSRGSLASPLTGGGTFNVVANYVRCLLDGDWSAFTGLINVTSKSGNDEFRIDNKFGYANAAIFLNAGVIMDRASGSNPTNEIGELGGTAGSIIGPGNSSSANPVWRVGSKNTTNTFAGVIANDGVSSIIKVGTGTWILSGQNTYSGSTIISNGVLALTNDSVSLIDGSIGNSTNILIKSGAFLNVIGRSDGTMPVSSGQVIGGEGTIRGILDTTAGGTVSPGGGINGSVGTLTVTNTVTLGGTAWMKLNRSSSPNSDRLVSSPASVINYGGTLVVTNVGPALQVGDTFTLFSAATRTGSFTLVLPSSYTWNTSQLTVNGQISVTAVATPPTFSNIMISGSDIILNATGGVPSGGVSVLTSTNLTVPIAQWTTVTTGNFDGSGNFTYTVTGGLDPANPQQFYILQVN